MNDNNKLLRLHTILDEHRGMLRRMLAVQEAEHRHLVSLLHDDFGQALVAIKSFAAAISSLPDDDMSEAHELADMIKELSQDVYISAYDLMRELRAGLIDELGLEAGVEHCIQSARLREREVAASTKFTGELEALDEFIKVMVLRIIQECLTVIMRNGKPSLVELDIALQHQRIDERRQPPRAAPVSDDDTTQHVHLDRCFVNLEIKTDKSGADSEQISKSTLLQKTHDRISALGGQLSVDKDTGQGWRINVTLDVTGFMQSDETN